ncbi:MAG: glycosyltransferase family 4 protein [Weeksellaceae bacterium]
MVHDKNFSSILILGSFNSSINVYFSEIETFKALQDFGFHITIVGTATTEVKKILQSANLTFIEDKPRKTFDKAFTKRIELIIDQRNVDILYVRTGKYLKSIISFIHKNNIAIVTYYGSGSLHWYDPFAYLNYLNPKVDKIVCNSRFVYEHVKKQLINKNKAVKIYKGYSTSWFQKVQPYDYTQNSIPSHVVKVIMVARRSKVKDIPTFLKVAQALKMESNIQFILVGKGLTKENLKKDYGHLLNSNLHLLGFRQDAVKLIKGADIYVQTSISEGLGRGISEAEAMGKPIIITNAGGCVELVDHNINGFVVPIGDYKSIATHIRSLAENQPMRDEMGQASINKIKQDISIEHTITGFKNLFNSLNS